MLGKLEGTRAVAMGMRRGRRSAAQAPRGREMQVGEQHLAGVGLCVDMVKRTAAAGVRTQAFARTSKR
jgi:hypothetical protein